MSLICFSRHFTDFRDTEHFSQTTCFDLAKLIIVTPFSDLHASAGVGSILLVMGMIMTFWLLSYPWLSLSEMSLTPSIHLSESQSLVKIIYISKKKRYVMSLLFVQTNERTILVAFSQLLFARDAQHAHDFGIAAL